MKNLLLSILLIISTIGIAQATPTYSKLFSDSNLVGGGVNLTSLNDTVYLSMYSQSNSSSFQHINFIKVHPSGAELKRREYKRPFFYYSPGGSKSFKTTSNGYLMCAGDSADNRTATGSGVFFLFDSDLEEIRVKGYNLGNLNNFYGFGELSNGTYLFSGESTDTTPNGIDYGWIVKTDTLGNILWQRTFNYDTFNKASFTSPFRGGFYQYWSGSHPRVNNSGALSALFVDRYDNNGNLQWRDTFGVLGRENRFGGFTATKDGGAVLVLNTLDTTLRGNIFNTPHVIYKIDSFGNLAWTRYYADYPKPNYLRSIIESSTGNIILCGQGGTADSVNDPNNVSGGVLWKMNKDGKDIFYNIYKYDSLGPINILMDITETSDGGYAAVGEAYHKVGTNTVQAAWLLKVDSNGCLNGDCPTLYTAIEEPAPEQTFFVFPSPATVAFTVAISSASDVYRYPHLHFALYDLMGRLVLDTPITQQTSTITREGIADGVYVYQLLDGDRYLMNGKMVLR